MCAGKGWVIINEINLQDRKTDMENTDIKKYQTYEQLFENFRKGLENWSVSGQEPGEGNQDVRYFLDLQENRLRQWGIHMAVTLKPVGNVLSVQKTVEGSPFLHNLDIFQMNQSIYTQSLDRCIHFMRNGVVVHSHNAPVCFYETIIDPEPGQKDYSKIPYSCPNCGAISPLEILQEQGCPYCKTSFLMGDFYPKVANFYSVDTRPVEVKPLDQYIKITKKASLIGGGTAAYLSLFPFYDMTIGKLFSSLFFSCMIAVASFLFTYLFLSLRVMFSFGKQAGNVISMNSKGASARKIIASKLAPLDPSFDYGYFEGKALSLAKIIMLSQNPDQCVQYQGPVVAGSFYNVLDIQYRGGIEIHKVVNRRNKIRIAMDLYVCNTVCAGGQIIEQNEKIQMVMEHWAQFPVKPVFSIVNVQCPSCGGKFDARKIKNCPHCGGYFDPGHDDWVVTMIRRTI